VDTREITPTGEEMIEIDGNLLAQFGFILFAGVFIGYQIAKWKYQKEE